jgi:cyclopropane fatty-acyl-phospholipid synthase-like methyltransferase
VSEAVPERLRWAVELLGVRPDDRILEVGCGPGVAVALVADLLVGGRITGIDRSATAIDRAARRNARHVETGRVRLACIDLAGAAELGQQFDTAFAVDVNLFWTGDPSAELAVLRRLLGPHGTLHLIYETPGYTAHRTVAMVAAALTRHGVGSRVTTRSARLACVTATLRTSTLR